MCPFIAWIENVSGGEMRGHLRISLFSRTAITSPSSPTAPCTHWPSLSLDSVPLAVVLDQDLGGNNTHISEKRMQWGRNSMKRAWYGFDLLRRNRQSVRTLKKCSRVPFSLLPHTLPGPHLQVSWKSTSTENRMLGPSPSAQPSILTPQESEPSWPL